MASYNLGPYRLNPRGEYDGETSYKFLDLVYYKGSGYVCSNEDTIDGTACIGVAPTGDTTSELYWMLIVDASAASASDDSSSSDSSSSSYSDYEYAGFVTLDDLNWDYSVTDKVIIPETTSTAALNITNVYDGCCGLIVTKNSKLSLPLNSATSIDFNYATLQTGQFYLYSFVYYELDSAGTFIWNRTVVDQ